MDVPPEIAFRHIEPTQALKDLIAEGIDSLEKVHPRLVSCRVMVEDEARGFPHVRLDIGVPGSELVIRREATPSPAPDVMVAVREAFDVARRQLREHRKIQTGEVKRRELSPHGRVIRLVTDEAGQRYGFILTDEGRQVYFHESVLEEISYDEIEEGMEVSFVEAGGREDPQASSISPLVPVEEEGPSPAR